MARLKMGLAGGEGQRLADGTILPAAPPPNSCHVPPPPAGCRRGVGCGSGPTVRWGAAQGTQAVVAERTAEVQEALAKLNELQTREEAAEQKRGPAAAVIRTCHVLARVKSLLEPKPDCSFPVEGAALDPPTQLLPSLDSQ